MSIYKPCDIRGQVASELTPELYRTWGRLLGNRIEAGAKFVVGGDVRASTPEFLAALTEGLCLSGVDVVELGPLPTPMIYYARHRLRASGCAIVTASHNPAEINGLKWMVGDRPPTQEEVAALGQATETAGPPTTGRSPSVSRSLDVTFDYVAWLQETWVEAISAQRHVVLDPMHGCWARRARRYLQAIFPQCFFWAVHDEPDLEFAGRSPDCSQPHLLEDLCDAVERQRAHLGLAFDGDRVVIVDENGTILTAEEATWCLMQSLAAELRQQPFVYDLKFSDCVPEKARQLGAEPVVERSGHAFIRNRMLQTGALFGAEVSGHYFFRATEGGDDGLYAACRLISHLAQSPETLSELRRQCPPVFVTPDLRVSVAPRHQQPLIDRVRAAWSDHPQTAIDGVRIDFPDGWALIRSSVTESALTFRFEAAHSGWLTELVRRFCDALDDVGDELWGKFEAAMGTHT